ncbi:hypothetical protein DH2020_013589 [Rehmannia glutinosa]|uniref:Uncharacterized protein n=1 Tax=Rehmannia glutinosa TaxID=99300 RepID=A0ABR0X3C6_REHGL
MRGYGNRIVALLSSRVGAEDARNKMKFFRRGRDIFSIGEFKKAQDQYNLLLAQQEDFWKQRAKIFWLKGGDANTKYFHTVASSRKRHNLFDRLKNEAGSWLTWDSGLGNHIVNALVDENKRMEKALEEDEYLLRNVEALEEENKRLKKALEEAEKNCKGKLATILMWLVMVLSLFWWISSKMIDGYGDGANGYGFGGMKMELA